MKYILVGTLVTIAFIIHHAIHTLWHFKISELTWMDMWKGFWEAEARVENGSTSDTTEDTSYYY